MKKEDLFDAVGGIDEELIGDTLRKQASSANKTGRRRTAWLIAAAIATAIAIAAVPVINGIVKRAPAEKPAVTADSGEAKADPTDAPSFTAAPAEPTEKPEPTPTAVYGPYSLPIKLLSCGSELPAERLSLIPVASRSERLWADDRFVSDLAAPQMTVSFDGTEYTGSYTSSGFDYCSYTTDFYECEDGVTFGVRTGTNELVYLNLATPEFMSAAAAEGSVVDGERYTAAWKIIKKLHVDTHYYVADEESPVDGLYEITAYHGFCGVKTSSFITVRVTAAGKFAMFRIGDPDAYSVIHDTIGFVEESFDVDYFVNEAIRNVCDEHRVAYPEDWIAHTTITVNPEGNIVFYIMLVQPITADGTTYEPGFMFMTTDLSCTRSAWVFRAAIEDLAGLVFFGDAPSHTPEYAEPDYENNLFTLSMQEANDEQKAKLEEIAKRNSPSEWYEREILMIMGKLPADTPRLTPEKAGKILKGIDPADYERETAYEAEVIAKFNEYAGAPDFRASTGVIYAKYYVDDSAESYIIVSAGSVVYYYPGGDDTLAEYGQP